MISCESAAVILIQGKADGQKRGAILSVHSVRVAVSQNKYEKIYRIFGVRADVRVDVRAGFQP